MDILPSEIRLEIVEATFTGLSLANTCREFARFVAVHQDRLVKKFTAGRTFTPRRGGYVTDEDESVATCHGFFLPNGRAHGPVSHYDDNLMSLAVEQYHVGRISSITIGGEFAYVKITPDTTYKLYDTDGYMRVGATVNFDRGRVRILIRWNDIASHITVYRGEYVYSYGALIDVPPVDRAKLYVHGKVDWDQIIPIMNEHLDRYIGEMSDLGERNVRRPKFELDSPA